MQKTSPVKLGRYVDTSEYKGGPTPAHCVISFKAEMGSNADFSLSFL
jgi:hypothetical protein